MQNNSEQNEAKGKTLSKTIRNRVVGVLVLLSLVLICVPSLMKKEVVEQKNSIAINSNGAITDDKGRLVSADEHNYNDLLDPVDDLSPASDINTPNAASASSPFDALNQNTTATTTQNTSNNLDVPNDDMFASSTLEVATPTVKTTTPSASVQNQATVSQNTVSAPVASQNTVKTEVLRSSQAQSTQQAPKPAPAKVVAKTAPQPTANVAIASGNYAAQVGVFSNPAGANNVVNELKQLGFAAISQKVNINGKSQIKVYAGTSKNKAAVQGICQRVQAKSNSKYKCFVQSL